MPELPEVETMVRGIRPYLEQKTLLKLQKCPCSKRPIQCRPSFRQIANRLKNDQIIEVTRLAKRIVIHFQSEQTLLIEPRMTGLMLANEPPTTEHLRFEFLLKNSDSTFFWDRRGLGTVTLYDQDEFQDFLQSGKLGPDALKITPSELFDRLQKTQRAIKVVLLDQKVVAGIGNLYASEILFLIKTHPEKPACNFSREECGQLTRAIKQVLNTAIKYEGSTLGDGTYRNVLNQDGSYQNQHRVYQKEGEKCTGCSKGKIIRIVQAQRSTFFCPACQPH